METKVAPESECSAVQTRYYLSCSLLVVFCLSSLQCWWAGREARHGSCSLETSSWLASACYCPQSTGFMWPLRTHTPSSRLFLDSWDRTLDGCSNSPILLPGSVCKLVSGIGEHGQWGLCGQWGQSLEAGDGMSALCDVGQNQGRKGQ